MRTKALLSAAAALAVGAVTAQAQVYSVNIVGYVNQELPGSQFALVQNPLDDGTNTLGSVLPDVPNGSLAYIWNGAGYDIQTRGKAGWANPSAAIPTGSGFFLNLSSPYTNTYVGEVVAASGESVTNSLANGILDLVGSLLPYAGSVTNSEIGLDAAPNGTLLYQWSGSSFTISTRGKAGWQAPIPSIDVAEGFFMNPGADFDWVQALPAN